MKNVTILCMMSFLVLSAGAKAQELPVSKNAAIFSLGGNFSSMQSVGVVSLDGTDFKTKSAAIFTKTDFFFTRYFYAGIGFDYAYTGFTGYKDHFLSIGPNLGFAYTRDEWPVVARVNFSYRKQKTIQEQTDYDEDRMSNVYYIGGGIIIPVKGHIGVTLDGHYVQNFISANPGTKGFRFTLGISGLLYRPDEN